MVPAAREKAETGRLWAELLRKHNMASNDFLLLFHLGYKAAFLYHASKPHRLFLSKFFSPVSYKFLHFPLIILTLWLNFSNHSRENLFIFQLEDALSENYLWIPHWQIRQAPIAHDYCSSLFRRHSGTPIDFSYRNNWQRL